MTERGQLRFSFPAFRVFVFGVEVTDDVSTCNINWGDGRAPGTAEFVLASPLDRYVTTPVDIHAMYDDITVDQIDPEQFLLSLSDGTTPDVRSASDSLDKAIQDRIDRTVNDPLKRLVLRTKISERVRNQSQAGIADGLEEVVKADRDQATSDFTRRTSSPLKFAALTGDFVRFPFQVGQCIFHTGDAVRIFWRDPFDASKWYFAATGAMSDWRESVEANGKKTVTITVEDALRNFKLSRFATNFALFDNKVVADRRFDTLWRTWLKDHFSDLTLPEILFLMTFGITSLGANAQKLRGAQADDLKGVVALEQYFYGIYGKTNRPAREHGVGVFNYEGSAVFSLGGGSPTAVDASAGPKVIEEITTLEDWQQAIDHQVSTDFDTILAMAPTELQPQAQANLESLLSPTSNALDVRDVITEIGSHPELYPVDFGRVMMLAPSSLGPGTNRDILLKDITNGISEQTEFSTRLQILYNICQRIDFSFYATPRGDVVCEMPLYSFRPEDFGSFADRYRFSMEDVINWESHFEDEKVRTLFQVGYWTLKNRQVAGLNNIVWRQPGTASLQSLIPQFGVRGEKADPWGFINTREAAAYYAHIKLTQMNADAWVQSINTVLHMGVGPNRPCWFEPRDFIATTRMVNASIVWGMGGSVQQNFKVNYRRGWSGLLTSDKPPKHVYESFGGRMAQPLDYSLLMQFQSNKSDTSTKELTAAESITPTIIPAPTTAPQTNADRRTKLANKVRFKPGSVEQFELFTSAITKFGGGKIPNEWASDPNLSNLLSREPSAGRDGGGFAYVGIPNLASFGALSADPDSWDLARQKVINGDISGLIPVDDAGRVSTAIGLGQMIVSNVKTFYPSGTAGIGNPEEESIGMLRYIKSRYGDPATAWAYWKAHGSY